MTRGRMLLYGALWMWSGGLSVAAQGNIVESRWSPLAVNVVILVVLVTCLAVMGRRDLRRGAMQP